MDVVAGISLAASVMTLVDFGFKLTRNAKQISRSADGSLDTNHELEEITTRINDLSKSLQAENTENSPSLNLADAKYHESIRHLARRSEDVSSDLILHLQDLKSRKSRGCYDVPITTIRSMLGGGRTKDLKENLHSLQQTLRIFLEAQMSDKQDALFEQLRKLRISGVKELERNREDIIGAIKQFEASHTQSPSYRKLSALLDELAKNSREVITTQILRSLAYDGMTARQSRISEAYQKTFEWVFRDSNIRFNEWLEMDPAKDVYWVTGKPGSGKSTLMNFLYNHKRTRQSLQVWAGPDRQLALGSHFFWALGGTERQKSLEGLLRSLLHGVLRQCPRLIHLVCPAHIQHTFNSGNRDPWTIAELWESFTKITQLDQTSSTRDIAASTRFCFFIDGLDEYAGQKADLIKLCNMTIRPTYIKLCVASRSWPAFRDAFTGDRGQMLELHELTKVDIWYYTQSKLCGHSRVVAFKKRNSVAFVSLVDVIVYKAQGVFLWVYLVVQSLLDGLSNDDGPETLKQRLEQLPGNLNEYYQHVLNGIEPIYRKETARIIRMFLCAIEPIPLLCLPPALQTSTYQTVDVEVARSPDWATESISSIRKQLHARCRDFLQIEPDPTAESVSEYYQIDIKNIVHCQYRVDFLHLSAREVLKSSAVTQQLIDWDQEFHKPYLLLCKCYMFLFKVLPDSIFEGYWNIPHYWNGTWSVLPSKQNVVMPLTNSIFFGYHYLRPLELSMRDSAWALIDDFKKLTEARTDGKNTFPPKTKKTERNFIRLQDDFLPWALQIGLPIYVEGRIRQDPDCITEQNKIALLYLAATTVDQYESPFAIEGSESSSARLYIMQAVLNRGVNPSEENFDTPRDSTLWDEWLRILLALSLDHVDIRRDTFDRQNRFFGREDLLARTNMLLQYGADPNVRIQGVHCGLLGSGSYNMTAIEVFREIFRPEQVAILMESIRKSQKAGVRRSKASEEHRLESSSGGTECL